MKKLLSILILLTAAMFAFAMASSSVGNSLGTVSGTLVGTAIGSVNGVIDGLAQGAEDGTAAGLSATDLTVSLQNEVVQVGNLEVLVATVTITDLLSIGEAYRQLYAISGDAIFSVDLGKALVTVGEGEDILYITLPEPEISLYLNQSTTEKLAEVSNFSLTVGTQESITAYLNSMANMQNAVEEKIDNYDSLVEQAKASALTQVQQLARAICGTQQSVIVQFPQEEVQYEQADSQ